ncbi:hypothetical protein BDQ12DRAFT_673802 [Crucibulum laeve]|uniref:Uncharacterized protein n=1 Tax=Crucibulum laeve TaxID=68775 RepID=A0A5C3MHR1_9AGAR|nr:hypothetical protein BDQ12DRAFT_673802 [Crucibulum laeve]
MNGRRAQEEFNAIIKLAGQVVLPLGELFFGSPCQDNPSISHSESRPAGISRRITLKTEYLPAGFISPSVRSFKSSSLSNCTKPSLRTSSLSSYLLSILFLCTDRDISM